MLQKSPHFVVFFTDRSEISGRKPTHTNIITVKTNNILLYSLYVRNFEKNNRLACYILYKTLYGNDYRQHII